MQTFVTLSELSRATGHPVSRLNAAIQGGQLIPDGKAGASPNGAVIFRADRLDAIKTALAAGTPAPAPKGTTDLSEITGKAQAIRRAKLEGLK